MPAAAIVGIVRSVSAKIILAFLSKNAFAVDIKVKEGTMTSSPGLISAKIADISSASVQDVVRSDFLIPNLASNHEWQSFVNFPFPASVPDMAVSISASMLFQE